MTPPPPSSDRHDALSRREREILDLVYARGEATAAEVHQDMADPPSYSAVRGLSGPSKRLGRPSCALPYTPQLLR